MKKGCFPFLILLLAASALAAADQTVEATRDALMTRLAAGGDPRPLFPVLTPLLLDYAETILTGEKITSLYGSSTPAEFLKKLEALSGKDLLDLGADMFAFFESKPATGDAAKWDYFPAGPFLVYVHPGRRR
ncbi:MAG: hypothetical protein NTW38_07765 [Candidatus Aminicenantes bacterium]|nr:hypothetical protein [Candidatus Aminicenantes bacterium]